MDDALLVSKRLEELQLVSWPELGDVALFSARSPSKETDNEDSALALRVDEHRAVVAVADGVGGHPAGDEASERALEALRAEIGEGLERGSALRECVLAGFDRANQSVMEIGLGCATTLVAAVIDDGRIRAYHVGDSGLVAFGGRGKLKLETVPHSPVGYGVEAGLISEEAARDHEDRHLVSNVVGDPGMHIGISPPLTLAQRDSVVLASDGLFDNLDVAEIVETLRAGDLESSVRDLCTATRAHMTADGHPDDLTVLVYRPATGAASNDEEE